MWKERFASIDEYYNALFEFDTTMVEEGKIEYSGTQALVKYQIDYTGEKVFLYGGGRIGFYTIAWLLRERCPIEGVIDSDSRKNGTKLLGIDVISMDIFRERADENSSICVLLSANLGEETNRVKKELFECRGVNRIIDIVPTYIYDAPAADRAYEYYLYRERFREMMDAFYDNESKEILCELIRCALYNDFFRGTTLPSCDKYFSCGELSFGLLPDEDLAIVGGGIGDTVYYFLNKQQSFKRITVFEPDNKSILENISFLPETIRNRIVIKRKLVGRKKSKDTITLDSFYKDEEPTLITMDVEGMELDVLHGARWIINNCKTIFAISAYHKWDDIIRFIELIQDLNSEYCFVFRKYASLYCMNANETVLYAIPKNRIISI